VGLIRLYSGQLDDATAGTVGMDPFGPLVTVPEPAQAAMIGQFGLAVVGWSVWRRRKAA
jgi:hypothetical protein